MQEEENKLLKTEAIYWVINTLMLGKGETHLRQWLLCIAESFPILIKFSTVPFSSGLFL